MTGSHPTAALRVLPVRIAGLRLGWRAWTVDLYTGELTPRRWAATRVGAIVRALYDRDPAVREAARNYQRQEPTS